MPAPPAWAMLGCHRREFVAARMVRMNRLLQHLLHSPRQTRKAFPFELQRRLALAIQASERQHRGEIRLVVEGDWPLADVWAGKTPQDRALEVFGLTRVWDTEENTGILIYVLLCEQQVEILADRGINARVSPKLWPQVCARLRDDYAQRQFEAGSLQAIEQLTAVLAEHFPVEGKNPNELPDAPIVWR